MDPAFVFIERLRLTFEDKPQMYVLCKTVMRSFLDGQQDKASTINQLKQLLREYPDILTEFERYLTEQAPIANFEVLRQQIALCYVEEVSRAFVGRPGALKEFHDIMVGCLSEHILVTFTKIKHLFREHPHLIQSFKSFLPPEYAISADVFQMPQPASP